MSLIGTTPVSYHPQSSLLGIKIDVSLFSFREQSNHILVKEDISSIEFPDPDKITLLFVEPGRSRF
jgi:hypothetical protein